MRVGTPINVNTGGRAEVMQTYTLETGVGGGWLSGMALRADVEIIYLIWGCPCLRRRQ